MECPVCHKKMSSHDFGGAAIDVCENGCKGLWFDWLELAKLDESHEGVGQALKDALNSTHHKDDKRGTIKCPKCQNPMHAHFYKSAKVVTVDECYACGGFYLDSGELEVVRGNFMSEADRDNYVKQLIAEVPGFSQAERQLAKDKLKVNPNAVKRADAVGKFADMLANVFQK